MANEQNTPQATSASAPSSLSAMSAFFLFFVIGAILVAAGNDKLQAVSEASFQAAKDAVTLAIGLIGIMALWLGLVRILEAGGLMFSLAEKARPLMSRLFPEVPAQHPAMSAMLLNLSANFLGLGNAATPFGIKAMVELNKLNRLKGVATNAMCLFLAINTSSITLLPLGAIGVRAAAGSDRPAEIFLPTLIATMCSTVVALLVATFCARRDQAYRAEVAAAAGESEEKTVPESEAQVATFEHLRGKKSRMSTWVARVSLAVFLGIMVARAVHAPSFLGFLSQDLFSYWLMPALMLLILCYGMSHGVKIYESVTEGAKQGFDIAVRIIPYLVAMLVSIGMFRASGAMELLTWLVSPLTNLLAMPAEVLPMALVRPLSGSGAFAIMSELVKADANSYSAYLASTIMGSTETTFYVLAVYFGAVGVTRVRYAVLTGLLADIAGVLGACIACSLMWQG